MLTAPVTGPGAHGLVIDPWPLAVRLSPVGSRT